MVVWNGLRGEVTHPLAFRAATWTISLVDAVFYNSIVQATVRVLSFLAWPPAIVMIVFATCTALLPNRYTLFPGDIGRVVAAAFYAFVTVSFLARSVPALRRAERLAALTLTALMSVVAISYFLTIIGRIATGGSTLKGGPLLEAAILVWIFTVLTFSLSYWLIDDGFDFFSPERIRALPRLVQLRTPRSIAKHGARTG